MKAIHKKSNEHGDTRCVRVYTEMTTPSNYANVIANVVVWVTRIEI